MYKNIAIIGGGITGYFVLKNLYTFLKDKKEININIFIIEKGDLLGPGNVYNNKNSFTQLCNNTAESMSLEYEDQYDFVNWIINNKDFVNHYVLKNSYKNKELIEYYKDFNKDIIKDKYYPRHLFGIYSIDKFNKCIEDIKKIGINIKILTNTFVENIITDNNKNNYKIILKNNDFEDKTENVFKDINKIFICTGHIEKSGISLLKNNKNYFNNPYNITSKEYKSMSGLNVGILGTGLTSIDTIMEIASFFGVFVKDNNKYKYIVKEKINITCFSRKGRLPRIRGKAIYDYKPKFFTINNIDKAIEKENILRLSTLLDIFIKEINHIGNIDVNLDNIFKSTETTKEKLNKNIDYILKNEDKSINKNIKYIGIYNQPILIASSITSIKLFTKKAIFYHL